MVERGREQRSQQQEPVAMVEEQLLREVVLVLVAKVGGCVCVCVCVCVGVCVCACMRACVCCVGIYVKWVVIITLIIF